MADKLLNVLFLCTDNSARSLFAESLLNRLGRGRFRGFSAGSDPSGEVHPLTVYELTRNNYDPTGLTSKHWEVFTRPDAPRMDFVFTLGDTVAAAQMPEWPGNPMTAHWAVTDPVAVDGEELQRKAAFYRAFAELESRVSILVNLPIESLDRLKLQQRLDEIGRRSADRAADPAA